jgi:hypothetical protein
MNNATATTHGKYRRVRSSGGGEVSIALTAELHAEGSIFKHGIFSLP